MRNFCFLFVALLLLPLALLACEGTSADDGLPDADGDGEDGDVPDGDDADGDLPGDGDLPADGDGSDGEEDGDVTPDGDEPDCEPGQWECSEDGYSLIHCEGGEWITLECMRERGELCEAGACVKPWSYGQPVWSTCPDDALATTESLAQKAAYYNDIMARLHLHPQLKWIMPVTLPCKPTACGEGQTPPCVDCSESAVPEEEATWQDVERWHSGENDGLWNAHIIMAEAFRYAVTGDEAALANLKILLEGERVRMAITGVPGVFTRQYIPPGVTGLSCPDRDESYKRDVEKDDNQWVQVREDGCVWFVDDVTEEWTRSEHCGLDEFAGYCWLDNVSKDEYSGHMAAIGAAGLLVDDPEVKDITRQLCREVATHLIENRLAIIDWDGRVTEHGRFWAMALDDFPGFNAAMALGYIKTCAVLTGDPEIQEWYANCLLQKGGAWDCLQRAPEQPKPYTEYLASPGLYIGNEGCRSNFNNISMHMHSLFNMILFEREPETREFYQRSLDVDVFRAPGQPRAVQHHNNSAYNFLFAALKRLGPGSDGPAFDAVENGVCMMRQFPARKHQKEFLCPPDKCAPYCKDRFDRDVGDYPRQVAERCMDRTFLWWADPYSLKDCTENTRTVYPPTDYLLAYWMGRYFGFITEAM